MTPPSITYTYNGKSLMNSVLAQAEPLRKPDAPTARMDHARRQP